MVKEFLKAKNGSLVYGSDLDIVKYIKGKRATINPSSQFNYNLTMDLFKNCKCSLRILRPHQMSDNLTKVIALFQQLFCSSGGANAYITPPPPLSKAAQQNNSASQDEKDDKNQNSGQQNKKSQGFAPHYDDVDTFILQLEGKKHWKLHKYQHQSQILAINPSNDFDPNSNLPPLIWEGVLEQGDLLYMPRGVIHHAHTVGDKHSLHVTLSNQQHNTWGEFIRQGVTNIVNDLFIHSSLTKKYRRSLPECQFTQISQNEKFQKFVNQISNKITPELVFQHAIDSKAKEFQFNRQNPVQLISTEEIEENKEEEEEENREQIIGNQQENDEDDEDDDNSQQRMKLMSLHCISLGTSKLYYSTFNSRGYQEVESQYMILENDWKIAVIRELKRKYPNYTSINELQNITGQKEALRQFIDNLADKHILIVE